MADAVATLASAPLSGTARLAQKPTVSLVALGAILVLQGAPGVTVTVPLPLLKLPFQPVYVDVPFVLRTACQPAVAVAAWFVTTTFAQ